MQRKNKHCKLLFIFIFLLGHLLEAASMTPNTSIIDTEKSTIFQLLQTTDHVVIRTNLDSLFLNKKKEKYQTAQLTALSGNATKIDLSIKIKGRGKSRRNMCELPPLKLNFKKTDLANLGVHSNFDKLKLVTHCQLDGTMENLLLKEYWTYKLYNELSVNSFKVKLVKITYMHELDVTRKIDSYAFIIENSDEMAHRIGGTIVKQYGVTSSQIIPSDYHNLLVFNYMIGNTDWDLRFQQNIKLVKIEGKDQFIAVPYDFDQAKLVGAPYIKVDKKLGLKKTTNRYVMDPLHNPIVLANSIKGFKYLKKNSFQSHENCPYLKKKDKKKMSKYLNSFYSSL